MSDQGPPPLNPSDNVSAPIIPSCTVVPNCPLSADIVLVSSDGVRFGTHTQNLGQCTGAFPLDIAPQNGEDIHMPDMNSATLNLFLQFVHNRRQPDLDAVGFDTLKQLAEAVEKYDVYSATEICKMHMKLRVSYHSLDVFLYACRHGYHKVMDDAARIAIQDRYSRDLIQMQIVNPALAAAWTRYTEYWISLFDVCRNEPPPILHRGGIAECNNWRKFSNVVRSQAKLQLTTFMYWNNVIENSKHYLKDCRHCNMCADKWMYRGWNKITEAQDLKDFTSFLNADVGHVDGQADSWFD